MPQPHIQETGFDGVITEIGLALIAAKDSDWNPVGTAVIIAPRLAITAKHVVNECWRCFGESNKLRFSSIYGNFGLLAVQVLPQTLGVLWAIRKLWTSPHTDLAVLQLEPFSESAQNYHWRTPILHVQPPSKGAVVRCFGYRGGSAASIVNCNEMQVNWECSPCTAGGVVVDVHYKRRDLVMFSFPCFETNAPFTHGMSGGPIFVDGSLSGIICGSGHERANGEKRAYGTSLWPVLATKLEVEVASVPGKSTFTVYELAKLGFIKVMDLDTIAVKDDPSGEQQFETSYPS